MEVALIHILLVINGFHIATENQIFLYRFKVYPVDKCPMNSSEFEAAATRRNCSDFSRYLCAPDRNLSNLIEFCTDKTISLFEKDNCLRLEGTGDLNHYRCRNRFISGCPTMPYTDERLFKYPACLDINTEFNCFVADKDCPERWEKRI